jgi:hypothetical protein
VLQCVECGTVDYGAARRWRAYLGLEDDDVTETLVVLCQACAEREFGETHRAAAHED